MILWTIQHKAAYEEMLRTGVLRANSAYIFEEFFRDSKTLQYLMGHSDISVTMNVCTHISFDDAEEELRRMEEFRKAQTEVEKQTEKKAVTQKMFKVV